MEWLFKRFASAPGKKAFIHMDREVTYGDVLSNISNYQGKLIEAGVKSGDCVLIVGDYSPEMFCMILAVGKNRSIIIPLTPGSVLGQEEALSISGCQWRVSFQDASFEADVSPLRIESANEVLAKFRASGVPGLILFSSGSTGKPKGILHDIERVAKKFNRQRAPVIAIPFLMIDHFGGINTILAITSSLGTVVTVSDRSAAGICKAIAKHRVELLPATPSFLTLLMASGVYRQYDLSCLKRITYGTEVMPQSTLDRVKQAFPGVELQQTYGLSEVGVLRSKSRDDGSLWLRLGGEGFQTKVVDGILWIKSEYSMIGYLNAPSEFDAEGWFNTQDRVEVDGDYFRILGRVTDIINVGGEKVYPAEVENVILTLDNIRDVAVYGETSPLLGNIVVAKVLLDHSEPADGLKRRIRKACGEKLTPFKVPSKVIISDSELLNTRQKKVRRG